MWKEAQYKVEKITKGFNKSAKAAEIKRTAKLYKEGKFIDIAAVIKSRVDQDATKKSKKST